MNRRFFTNICYLLFPLLILMGQMGASAKELSGQPLTREEIGKQLSIYQHLSTLKVNFKQIKDLSSIGTKLESTGKFTLIQAQKKLIWEIEKPSPLLVTLSEGEMRIESGQGKEKQIQILKMSDAGEQGAQNLAALIAWLRLDANALFGQYTILKIGEQKFSFTPREPAKSPFQKLEMQLDKSGHVQKLFLLERSKDSITIEFGKPLIR